MNQTSPLQLPTLSLTTLKVDHQRSSARRHLFVLRAVEPQRSSQSPVSLQFRVPYETVIGEELVVTGQGSEALGDWVPQNGVKLSWTEGHQWRSKPVQATPDAQLKFKVVLLRGNGHVYEPGPDRILDCVSASPALGAHTEVLCLWGQPCQLLPIAPSSEEAAGPAVATSPAAAEQQAELFVEPLQAAEASKAAEATPTTSRQQASPHPVLCSITAPVFETQLGQYLVVVGSSQELGAWVPERGLPMLWQPGHAWKAELPVHSHNAGEDVEFKLACFNGGAWVWEKGPNRTLSGLDSFIAEQEGAIPKNNLVHITCPWEAPLDFVYLQASESSTEQQQQDSVANEADRVGAAARRVNAMSSAIASEVPNTEDGALAEAVTALADADKTNGDGKQAAESLQTVHDYLLSSVNGNGSVDINTVRGGSGDSGSFGTFGQQAVAQELHQVDGQPDARDAEIQALISKRQAAEWALHAQRTAAAEAAMSQQQAQEDMRAAEARAQQLSKELRAAQQQAEQLAIEAQERMISLGLELAGLRQKGRMETQQMAREMEGMRQEVRDMALKQAEEMKLRNQELADMKAKHAEQVGELHAELETVRETARFQLEQAETEVQGLKWQLLQAQADLQDQEKRLQESVAAREALKKQHAQELKEQQEAQVQQLQEMAQQQQALRAEQEAEAASALQHEIQAANERAQEVERVNREELQAMKQMAESQVAALQTELSEMRAQQQGATALEPTVSVQEAGYLKSALGQSQEEMTQLKLSLEKANIEKLEEITRLKESLAHHKKEVTRMRSELKSGARQAEGLRAELAHSQFDNQDLRNMLAAREMLVQNLQRELEDLEETVEDTKRSISRGLGMVMVPPRQPRLDKPSYLLGSPAEPEHPQLMPPSGKQQEEQQQQQQQQQQEQQQKPRKGLIGMISSLFGNGQGSDTQGAGPSNGTANNVVAGSNGSTANNVVAADGLSATEINRKEQMSARK